MYENTRQSMFIVEWFMKTFNKSGSMPSALCFLSGTIIKPPSLPSLIVCQKKNTYHVRRVSNKIHSTNNGTIGKLMGKASGGVEFNSYVLLANLPFFFCMQKYIIGPLLLRFRVIRSANF